MEPFKASSLPIDYAIDKELLKLISEANEKYGEYKSYLKTLEFDSKFFLDSLILAESLKSTQIEGTQISQDDMYYLKYMPQTDDNIEIQNLKSTIEFAYSYIRNNNNIDIKLVNEMHRILLTSTRGAEKKPGFIRTTQNWIGMPGSTMDEAIFIPPTPEDVPLLLDNLFKYMNDKYIDPIFVNLAISHSQFETIHAYRDGNGRLGRALIPIQLSLFTGNEPNLFLSEIIEIYKPSYQRFLNESRNGNMLGFIKFFLQCIIEQCNSYVNKIVKIKATYKNDMEIIDKNIRSSSVYKIMPILLKQIIFTKSEIAELTGISRNTVSSVIDKLVELNIISPDTKYAKKYKYTNIYNIFVR